jgi:hypothetical protein
MITTIYVYKENDILNPFIERQIKEAELDGVKLNAFAIDSNPDLAEYYDVRYHHTVIFKDTKDNELYRIEGPFSADQLKKAHNIAKTLANSVN